MSLVLRNPVHRFSHYFDILHVEWWISIPYFCLVRARKYIAPNWDQTRDHYISVFITVTSTGSLLHESIISILINKLLMIFVFLQMTIVPIFNSCCFSKNDFKERRGPICVIFPFLKCTY